VAQWVPIAAEYSEFVTAIGSYWLTRDGGRLKKI
jgi:hypothetical protein